MNDAELFHPHPVSESGEISEVNADKNTWIADPAEDTLLGFTAETNLSIMMSFLILIKASCLHLSYRAFLNLQAIYFITFYFE